MSLEAAANITSRSEIEAEHRRLREAVAASSLPSATKAALGDQLQITFDSLRAQPDAASGATIRSKRVLQGDGYRIIIQTGPASAGLMPWLRRLFGR